MPTITPCVRASLPPSNANCSNGGASPRSSRHAWPASASSKASTIPPGGTPPWGIARPFATNRRCKQTDSPPPPEPSTKSGQLQFSLSQDQPSIERGPAKAPPHNDQDRRRMSAWPDEQLVKGTWLPPAIERL